ncbi:MAG TPA: MFS transporter [Thermomicrobiales bacterium]|nr:MFS transporter [Thermomicrobiales bacterium]
MNGLTTSEAGLVLTPGAVAVVVGARLSGRLSDRIGPRIPVTAGLITLALAIVYLSTVAAGGSSWLVTLGAILASAGASLVNTPLNNAAAKTLPRQHMGVGMGLHSGTAFLGGGAGVAVAGAILAARQDAATGALNPFYRLDAAAFSDAFLAIALVPLVALALARSLGAPTVTPATVEAPLAPRAAERLETQRT